jgi:hypothetical protein
MTHPAIPDTAAARDVLAERLRQIQAEGWCAAYDDTHTNGELAFAAACYAEEAGTASLDPNGRGDCPVHGWAPEMWPFRPSWWKPEGRRRTLVKAGALILAEIERLDRAANRTGPEETGT